MFFSASLIWLSFCWYSCTNIFSNRHRLHALFLLLTPPVVYSQICTLPQFISLFCCKNVFWSRQKKYKVFVLCCICIMFVFVLVLCLYCLCICICSWQFVLNCPELSLQATKARAEFSAKFATQVRF